MEKHNDRNIKENNEHILVCLSSSPSNAKIVRTAAKMAKAFGGYFTALYVHTPNVAAMSDSDKKRLQQSIQLAESLGADIATVHGDDVSYQIAEFARLSAVTKIVIGRSNVKRQHIWSKPTLTEKLIEIAPNIDIHIIPDTIVYGSYRERKNMLFDQIFPTFFDLFITLAVLFAVTLIGTLFLALGFTETNIITVYILGVLLISLFTKGYVCSVLGALLSVILFNFFLTEPRFTFHAYASGYPVTIMIMLIVAILTGTLASKLKDNAKLSAQAAFRTKVLFDTNQLLQKAKNDQEIIQITAGQLVKLLDRDVIAYPEVDGELKEGRIFSEVSESEHLLENIEKTDKQVAVWVYENKKRAGATTKQYPDARCLYMAIRMNNKVYGVIGIVVKDQPLDSFENSVMLSILGECALAIENSRNAKEKEEAALLAKHEQLRANLLRSISHDLRTPLTSISGNASTLMANDKILDEQIRKQIFQDIYEDSEWLISLVENLLSVTRIEEGRMNFNMSPQIIDEVIEEALNHLNSRANRYKISVEYKDELLMARMDARLIMQVIINIMDNAIKYTPEGSSINLIVEKQENQMAVHIKDNGPGIADSLKPYVFDMFFKGESKIADSRRSLGLGLALCKSIIEAHSGVIYLKDHMPHGCDFTFTLPLNEVNLNE